MKMYFNVICEEISVLGGKIIHLDKNVGTLDEVHDIVLKNFEKFPNGKWELHTMLIVN